MVTKRRIVVGTIVFVFLGLLLYTFANPSQVNESKPRDEVKEETKENEKVKEEKEKVEPVKEENTTNTEVVNNNSNTNSNSYINTNTNTNSNTTDNDNAKKASLIAELTSLIKNNKEDYTTTSYNEYYNTVTDLINEAKNENNLSDSKVQEYIDKLNEATNKLVELKLTGLEVSSNNDTYKRLDKIKDLTFKAIYNDELRNKNVEVTTTDLFDTSLVAELKTMSFNYSDKYGSASVTYSYSVIKNDRDLLLDKLEELLNKEINEEDYTKDSVDNLNDKKDIDVEDLTNEEIEEAIEEIEEAIENLVELKLIGLEVKPNNETYTRLTESINPLTFTAIYNDETRNEEVETTTEDKFNTETIGNYSLTFNYSNKYGEASVDYNYTVIKNRRDNLLDKLEELLNKEINEEDYTSDSINNLKEAEDINPDNLTDDELEEAIEEIEKAIEDLVELKLIGLEVNSVEDEYKRFETIKELVFTAVYNDETRNKEVTPSTEDEFNTTRVAELKTMTFTYTDKYGEASTVYSYSVVKNERDELLESLISTEVDETKYTTDSVKDVKDAQNIENPLELSEEEVEAAIENIQTALDNLIEIELIELEINPNKDEYKRFESIKTLEFTAKYNDETKNAIVEATTEDEFDSTRVASSKTMEYSYTDDYGTITGNYNYSVVKNDRDELLETLINTTVNEKDYTSDSIKVLKDAQNIENPLELDEEEVEEAITNIQNALDNLVELELTELVVSPNNDTYTRGTKEIKTLTFTAIYNDETRNKTVTATTEGTFSAEAIGDYQLVFNYSDNYGEASATYSYKVVKSRRDELLERLDELLNRKINEDDYTTDSVNDLKEAKDINPDDLSDDELEEAIEKIEEAFENLVELELKELLISSNNDVYERDADIKTLTFTAIFNDDNRNGEVTPTTTDTFNSSSTGSRSMTYSYTNHGTATVTYNYTVVRNEDDKTIVGIRAELSENVFGYLTEVNIKNYLTVYTVAKDGVEEETTNYEVTGFTTEELTSSKEMTITHDEFDTTLTYSVERTEEGKKLNSISVKLDKNNYYWKEAAYIKTVTATDNDGTTYDVSKEAEILIGFDTNTVGEKEFKVSYTKGEITKEASTTYTVLRTNAGKKLDHITAEISDNKFARKTATESDLRARLTVTAFDIDGTKYVVTDYTIKKFKVDQLGTYTLTVSYKKSGVTKTADVTYEVVKNEDDLKIKTVSVRLSKTDYEINEEIQGLEVEVTYGYGNKEKLTTCTNDFDSTTAGYHKTLTVTCSGVNGTATYSVHNDELKGIKATLNNADRKYITNSAISVDVVYVDEYNRETKLNSYQYTVSPKLSTSQAGTYTSTITYKTYSTTVSYSVSEKYLFDIKIVDKKLVELKESYTEYIDITKIVVTYEDKNSTNYEQDGKHKITMVDYATKTCNFSYCTYTYPVYDTDEFTSAEEPGEDGTTSYKVPVKIEVYYGKASSANSLYHKYKLTYSVSNYVVSFVDVEDLGGSYYKY